MICNDCNEIIMLDTLIRELRTGYGVHNHVEDYYCPRCREQLYPSDRDWQEMATDEWIADEA